jgi:hypothetical protein
MKNFRLKSKYTELNLNYSLTHKQPKVHSEEGLIPRSRLRRFKVQGMRLSL